jgi:L-lactate dehydrogenase complex protein LldG
MTDARSQILGGIQKSLKRGPIAGNQADELEARTLRHAPNLIPARARGLDRKNLADLFERLAGEVQASVARVSSLDQVPDAVADYLARHNLPAEMTAAPDPLLDSVPWQRRPLLKLRRGAADGREAVGLSAAFAAAAETATLMLISGSTSPAALNFLPDTHVVVLPASRLVGPLEDAWARLRAMNGDVPTAGKSMPRTVNFITGPSRTGDIEQKIEMGAHGPRRLHIILVEDETLR